MRGRMLALAVVVVLVLVGCGDSGSGGPADDGPDSGTSAGSGELADPCSLIDAATLDSYFDEDVVGEPSGSGGFLSCTWSDSAANSILVSVANSSTVNHPDPCGGCLDLAFADDGYASSVPLQSNAEFVINDRWYSVSTTGLGDDVNSIAALAEQVYEAVSG